MSERLFSGMQPTGELHIGNYVGALRNWVTLLGEYDCIFCIVDYHALTAPYDVETMSERTFNAAVDYIAGGLDPNRCTIFVQSHVPQHTELAWVFATVTPLGQLMRMTQFKAKTQLFTDKSGDGEDYGDLDDGRSEFLSRAGKVNAGLLTYPILQASDILLYGASAVPVGEDQVQHIELTRDIARRFNNRYKKIFPECRPLLSEASRVVGLDGVSKMSKSIGNHIPMSLSPKALVEKITKESVSDPRRARLEDPGVPEECNVYAWHRIFSSEEDRKWAAEGCRTAGIGCFKCKKKVAQNMADLLAPYREKREELLAHPDDVRDVLRSGALRCQRIAEQTMEKVQSALGLIKRI